MKKGAIVILFAASIVSFGQISITFASQISNVNAQKTSTNSAKINWQKDARSLSDYVIIKSTSNYSSYYKEFDSGCSGTLSNDSISSCIDVTELPTGISLAYQVVSTFSNTLNTNNISGSGAMNQSQEVRSIEYPLVLTSTTETTQITTPTAPIAPTTLSATIATSTTDGGVTRNYVILQWNNYNTVGTTNSTKIIKYSNGIENEIPTTLNSTTMSSYSDYSVEPGIIYNYKIKVCNGDLCSYSPVKSVTIPQITVVPTIIEKPITTNGISTSTNSVTLNWVDRSSNETIFRIYRSGPASGTSVLISTRSAGNTTYADTNLSPGNYTYSIDACNEVTCSGLVYFSPQVNIPVIPITPTTLNKPNNTKIATSSSLDGIVTIISWDYVTGANAYKIVGGQQGQGSLSTFTSDSNSKIVGVNLPHGTYIYNVLACISETNCSASSTTYIVIPEINTAVINPTIPRPITPSGLFIATSTNGSANFSWSANTGFTYNVKNIITGAQENNKTSPYSLGTLSYGAYKYSVQSCSVSSSTICSDFAPFVQIIIPEPVISKPKSPSRAVANILLTYNNLSNVKLSWIDESNNEDYFKITRTPLWSNAQSLTQGSTQGYRTSQSSTYDDTGLSSGTYTYSISACTNNLGCSDSATASIVIAEAPLRNISGVISLPDSKFVVGARVTAYNDAKSVTAITDIFGKYSLSVPGGTYTLSVLDGNTSNGSWVVDNSIVVVSETDKVVNFSARPLVSTLRTIVKDELGNPVPNIGVVISSNDNIRMNTLTTDATGNTSALLKAGNYIVNTAFIDTLPYVPAEKQTVSINDNETKIITFVLKKKDVLNVFELRGATKFDDGLTTNAHISAWSDNGGSKSTHSSVDGEFSLLLASNDTWHISANKDKDSKSYETTEILITKNTYSSPVSLFFMKNNFESLPQTVSSKIATTETVKVEATDGASITLPPNSTNSSGSIDVQVKPTTEAPSQKSAEVISTVYDITIKNSTGVNVTTLSSEAKITLPYDEDELRAQGISVENLIPSYFDEKIGTWVSVPKFTIDKSKKTFTLFVQHLTRFALIASADTTAPSSPTNIVTDAVTPTDVKITWNNPQNDFHHAKVYRSEKIGSYGDLIAAEVFSSSFIDKTYSIIGKTYYYTVRAVDTAGNESSNGNQIATTVLGDKFASKNKSNSLALPPGQVSTGQITRKLLFGSKGDDVTALQKALKVDGFYVTGPITGYYGKLTRNAVTRFQNYYKEEILIPNGYKTGTGIVGEATRKKINEIIASSNL